MLTNEQVIKMWSEAIATAASEGTNDIIVFGRLVEKFAYRQLVEMAIMRKLEGDAELYDMVVRMPSVF